jgi:hypothetical protein
VARWDYGAKWGEAPAPETQCATPLGLTLSEVVRPHCAGAPAALWQKGRATEDFLLLRSEVRAQLHAVRPVIAAAALLEYTADCSPAATPRTRKERCW